MTTPTTLTTPLSPPMRTDMILMCFSSYAGDTIKYLHLSVGTRECWVGVDESLDESNLGYNILCNNTDKFVLEHNVVWIFVACIFKGNGYTG